MSSGRTYDESNLDEFLDLIDYDDERVNRIRRLRASTSPEDRAELLAILAVEGGRDDWESWLRVAVPLFGALERAADSLNGESALRSFSMYAISHGLPEAGLKAYARHLRLPRLKYGPFPGQNVDYLLTLLDLGRFDEVETEAGVMTEIMGRAPLEQLVSLAARGAKKDMESAERLRRIARSEEKPPIQRALAGYLVGRVDASPEWGRVVAEALGHRVWGGRPEARFRTIPEAHGIPIPAPRPKERPPAAMAAGNPKYVVQPGEGNAAWYGGDDWSVSKCPGCGHDTHVWFALRPQEIPELVKWLTWPLAPLVGCSDCGFWMGVNRYRVDPAKLTIELVRAELEGDKRSAAAYSTTAAPTRQTATLKSVTAKRWKTLTDKSEPTVVAGRPPRLGHDAWPRCLDCKDWMKYYAALGQSEGFEGQPDLLNGGGFLMHFACARCHTLAVVPNWT